MENTLLVGLSRQVTLERQMDVIANNVANVNTNGYKSDRSLFQEFLMPTAREVPPVQVLIREDAPSPLNPLGLKGAGEGGANAVGAVLAAAIDDALGAPNAVTELPTTPLRLKRLIRQAGRSERLAAKPRPLDRPDRAQ
jgi:hypothetical protein